jgi:hypothetical protein
MLLTIREMEVLCIFHNGSLSATLEVLCNAGKTGGWPPNRMDDLKSLVEKLSKMKQGETACIAFDS